MSENVIIYRIDYLGEYYAENRSTDYDGFDYSFNYVF